MRAGRLMLLLLALALVAGCLRKNDESSGGEPADADPDLISVQFVDVTAPAVGDCLAEGASAHAANFRLPAGAAWARIEGTFDAGRVALNVTREDGRRIGYAAAGPPVVVVLEEGALADAVAIGVKASACDGTAEQRVRVLVTFRRAAP